MVDMTRQLDILPPSVLQGRHVDAIGSGGIGSWVILALAKMTGSDDGMSMRVFDGDIVEPHNVASQFYSMDSATDGILKVDATLANLQQFADVTPEVVPIYLTETATCRLKDIVVVMVDSMEARYLIWEKYVRSQAGVRYIIDARMGAETGTIICAQVNNMEDERFYENTLFADSDAVDLPCTGRAIIYNGFWLASLISRQVKRILVQQSVEKRIDFDLDRLALIVND
jgi:hypothetical protein